MCGYFCIGFIDFMLKGKILLDYTNFLLMIMRRMIKNTKIFSVELNKLKCIVMFAIDMEIKKKKKNRIF